MLPHLILVIVRQPSPDITGDGVKSSLVLEIFNVYFLEVTNVVYNIVSSEIYVSIFARSLISRQNPFS